MSRWGSTAQMQATAEARTTSGGAAGQDERDVDGAEAGSSESPAGELRSLLCLAGPIEVL